jgi:hypothetical protein
VVRGCPGLFIYFALITTLGKHINKHIRFIPDHYGQTHFVGSHSLFSPVGYGGIEGGKKYETSEPSNWANTSGKNLWNLLEVPIK